jgi:hypothetical protein
LAGIGEPSAGDHDGLRVDGEEDQGIAEKVIARMSIIGAGRAMCGGARKIRAAGASVNGESLSASVQVQLGSSKSMYQSCTIIYNDG